MVRSLSTGLLAFVLAATPAFGQQPNERPEMEIPDVPPRPDDVTTIDGIVRAFYEVISGPPGEPRDWARDATLYLPGITFTPASLDPETGEPRARTISKNAFIRDVDAWMVEQGFVEREIGRTTSRFGNVAHVWSAYEWDTAEGESGRGVNGLHLFWDGERWWITHATWDAERPDDPIPPELLEGVR